MYSCEAFESKSKENGNKIISKSPMELVAVDFLVDLPITHRGNRHILSINDQFFKFTQLYAVPDRTAATSAKCVFDYFLEFGIAKKLYSDRDPVFESELFQLLMKMFGVKKLRATGYNPRANGLTEKGNEFIKNYLASYVNYSDKEWDLWCREASCAYKSRVQSSTGFTPAKLMFGRDYRVPIDVMYNVRNDDRKFSSIAEYELTLQDLYNVARESMQARQAAASIHYDRKVVDDELQVDELVYVLAPCNKSKKLALKWFCPSEIVKCCHPACEILVGNNTKWVTCDKLKRAPRGVNIQLEPDQPDIVKPSENPTEVIQSSDSDSGL